MLSKCLPLCCNSSPLYRFYSDVLRQGSSFEQRLALSSGPSCLWSPKAGTTGVHRHPTLPWFFVIASDSLPILSCTSLGMSVWLVRCSCVSSRVCSACCLPSCLALSVCDIIFSQGYHCLGGKQMKKGGRIEAQFFLLRSWQSVWKNLTYAAVPHNETYPSLCS